MKILIVVDAQNDFVNGPLGTKEAECAIPHIVNKINTYREDDNNSIIFTKDTHDGENYLLTLEGKKLPVNHCMIGSSGWELVSDIHKKIDDYKDRIVRKDSFGYNHWKEIITSIYFNKNFRLDGIELCGFCTDICVICNALIIKTLFPNIPIIVDAKCCAGSTPEKHLAALEVMKSCQIDIINE